MYSFMKIHINVGFVQVHQYISGFTRVDSTITPTPMTEPTKNLVHLQGPYLRVAKKQFAHYAAPGCTYIQ